MTSFPASTSCLFVGNMTGALVSGLLYKAYGAIMMFYINSAIAVASAIVYFLVGFWLDRCQNSSKFSFRCFYF